VNGLPDDPINTVKEDPVRKGLLFAGSETAIYVSFDDGDHWQSLRLNMPAIQAANYAAMPFQIALIIPFVRLGGWMFASGSHSALNQGTIAHTSSLRLIWASSSLAGQAFGAWFVTAIPMVLLMTAVLTALFRRVPVLAKAEAGD